METYQDYESLNQDPQGRLYNWVFHFNNHTGLWAAVHRSNYLEYWSQESHPAVIRSTRIDTLIELIQRTEGDAAKLEQLIGGK